MKSLTVVIVFILSLPAFSNITKMVKKVGNGLNTLNFQILATYRGERLSSNNITSLNFYEASADKYPCSQAGLLGEFGLEDSNHGEVKEVLKKLDHKGNIKIELNDDSLLCDYRLKTTKTTLKLSSPLNETLAAKTDFSFIYKLFRDGEIGSYKYVDYRGATIRLKCRLEATSCEEEIDTRYFRDDKVTTIKIQLID